MSLQVCGDHYQEGTSRFNQMIRIQVSSEKLGLLQAPYYLNS